MNKTKYLFIFYALMMIPIVLIPFIGSCALVFIQEKIRTFYVVTLFISMIIFLAGLLGLKMSMLTEELKEPIFINSFAVFIISLTGFVLGIYFKCNIQ